MMPVGRRQVLALKSTAVVGATPTAAAASAGKLHTRDAKLKFVMYWPRKSPFPDWWRQLDLGRFTWADVDADLDQIVATTGANAVRVFTYYDNQFRGGGGLGWTDGNGNHNSVRLDQLSTFIDKCKTRNLDVIVTMYQLLPALLSTDNWNFLENDIAKYESFHAWMLTMLKTKTNVRVYNLINEPDGYGVWNDAALAGRLLTFLNRLKVKGKQVAPDLLCLVNSTTHDNNFKRFPTAPVGATSIYELTEVLAQNTFLWTDTGYWAGQNYRTQCEYTRRQNVLNKPILMTECGFPADYAQQNVLGSPIINDAGTATGGNAVATDDSIVPAGSIFDRPKGTVNGAAHSPTNQARSIAEAKYWAELYEFDGLGVWAAFDHRNDKPEVTYTYRDSFGVIDRDGVPRAATAVVKSVFSGLYDANGEYLLSLYQGTSSTNSRINGLKAFDTGVRANNTIGGVYLAPGNSAQQNWKSDELVVGVPCRLRLTFNLRTANTAAEPLIIRLIGTGKQFDWRYKVYAVNAWQRFNSTSSDVSHGWSTARAFGAGIHTFDIDLTTGLNPVAYYDGSLLDYTHGAANNSNGEMLFSPWEVAYLTLQVLSSSDSAIDLLSLKAIGAAGSPIAFNPRNKKVIDKSLAF